ncbi:PstA family ABC transporter permease, partial [Phenylobacterium sp.]|uniref:PstA family ABC transporter permease n=1 Tax=Phenylobacterium sp. TaxID=1871053 RepID=UPI0039832F6F
MTDVPRSEGASPHAGVRSVEVRSAVQARLKARRRQETRFRWYGRLAITLALGFLAVLLVRIVHQGYTTFVDYRMSVAVYVDPARVDGADLASANYDLLVAEAVLARLGETDDAAGETSGKVRELLSSDLGFQILEQVRANPALIGTTLTVTGPVRADAALYYKGELKRSTAQDSRKLDDRQLAWLDRLKAQGGISSGFNVNFLTNSDSTEPEQAGVLGAVVGSAMMLLVTALLAVPIGVLAAVYLEEFAPKNRWTDVIEVNINNLAAVPSIVYGLLGLAVFINWMAVPRSSPLVGGLVLALMALPTVIIATRASLKAVPPSIREAALGVGASRTQTVFHHVLPLAMPGVMTGAILSLA